jgi:hypothetical protein
MAGSSNNLGSDIRMRGSPDREVELDLSPLLAGIRGIRSEHLDHRATNLLHGEAGAEEMSAEIG